MSTFNGNQSPNLHKKAKIDNNFGSSSLSTLSRKNQHFQASLFHGKMIKSGNLTESKIDIGVKKQKSMQSSLPLLVQVPE